MSCLGMSTDTNKKPVGSLFAYGVLSLILYAVVFSNEDIVMDYFTRGGWYASLPILTVFVFSFVHGSFAGILWDVLGIKAVDHRKK